MAKTAYKSVDEYIRSFPENVQDKLEEIRRTIQESVPEARETISYQMPAFLLHGKPLVYFSAWKKHFGLYPVTSFMKNSIEELSLYVSSGKGTIRFPFDEPIPLQLIHKIVKCRVKENQGKEEKKKKTR